MPEAGLEGSIPAAASQEEPAQGIPSPEVITSSCPPTEQKGKNSLIMESPCIPLQADTVPACQKVLSELKIFKTDPHPACVGIHVGLKAKAIMTSTFPDFGVVALVVLSNRDGGYTLTNKRYQMCLAKLAIHGLPNGTAEGKHDLSPVWDSKDCGDKRLWFFVRVDRPDRGLENADTITAWLNQPQPSTQKLRWKFLLDCAKEPLDDIQL